MIEKYHKERRNISKLWGITVLYYTLLCSAYFEEISCDPLVQMKQKVNLMKPVPLVEFLDGDEANQFGPSNDEDDEGVIPVSEDDYAPPAKSRQYSLELDETTECDLKSSVSLKATEDALKLMQNVLEFPVADDNVTNVQLTDGQLQGLNVLEVADDIEVTCSDLDIIIRAELRLPYTQLNYDWKITGSEEDGFIWATASDILITMVASVTSSAIHFPTVRIKTMKIESMDNFDYGNHGINAFGSAEAQTELFKDMLINTIENALMEIMSMQLQLQMAQSWHKTQTHYHEITRKRKLKFNTLFPGFGSKAEVVSMMDDGDGRRYGSERDVFSGMGDEMVESYGEKTEYIVGMPLINNAANAVEDDGTNATEVHYEVFEFRAKSIADEYSFDDYGWTD